MNIKRMIATTLVGMSLVAFTGCNSFEKTQGKVNSTVVAEVNGVKITREELDTYPQTINLINYVLEQYDGEDEVEDTEATENGETTEEVTEETTEETTEGTTEGTTEEELTEEEKYEKLKAIVENNEEAKTLLKENKLKILNELVFAEVLVQEAEKRELVSSDEEIEAGIEELREEQKNYFGSEEELNKALAEGNYTEESFRDVLRINVIVQKLQEDIIKDVTVEETEVKEYYDNNREKFPVDTADPSMYKLAHILVKTEEEAQEIKAKIDAGEDFAELAKEFSTDTGSGENGGDLGTVPAINSGFVEEFMDAALLLNDGDVSEPVQSRFGYHIIKCIEKDEKPLAEYDDVKSQIEEVLKAQKQQEVLSSEYEKIETEADIKTYEDELV